MTTEKTKKQTRKKSYKLRLLGCAGVDSGSLMIGDPCYWVEDSKWGDFCRAQFGSNPDHQVLYDRGHAGKGVVCSTSYGDGVYSVYGLKNDDDSDRCKVMLVVTDDLTPDDIKEIARGLLDC